MKNEAEVWEQFLRYCSHSIDPESWESLLSILGDVAELRGIDLEGILEKFKNEPPGTP